MKRYLALLLAALFTLGIFGNAFAEGEAPVTEQPTEEMIVTEQPNDEETVTEQPNDETEATEQPNEGEKVTEQPADGTEATEVPDEGTEATELPGEGAEATEQPSGEPETTEQPDDGYVTMAEGDWRVVMGANLSDEQRKQIYAIFGLTGELPESNVLTVTNEEERFYFEGKVPSSEIGTRSLSCIYIRAMKKGSGLDISTYNIDYCTEDMYRNVLLTVGITDARIIVAAPSSVSGTAALTGVYKAYESLTGSILSEYAKLAGIEELLATGELADMIGSEEATEIINELKKILDITKDMDDEAVMQKIREIAEEYNVELTETQIRQILTLARTLEGLDVEQIRQRALGLVKAANGWKKFTDSVSSVVEDIGNFFKEIAKFLSELFEKWFSKNE